MSMSGSCRCRNLTVAWGNIDYSLVPRRCGCEYCSPKGAAYVSKSGTRLELAVRKPHLHNLVEHGSRQARFHECAFCREVVMVSANLDGSEYGAVNVNCLDNRRRFAPHIDVNFSDQSAETKRQRWLQNWCYPVVISVIGSKHIEPG